MILSVSIEVSTLISSTFHALLASGLWRLLECWHTRLLAHAQLSGFERACYGLALFVHVHIKE